VGAELTRQNGARSTLRHALDLVASPISNSARFTWRTPRTESAVTRTARSCRSLVVACAATLLASITDAMLASIASIERVAVEA
jgi:hypothetical protein